MKYDARYKTIRLQDHKTPRLFLVHLQDKNKSKWADSN